MLSRKKEAGIEGDWDRLWAWAVGRVRWQHDREERHVSKIVVAWSEPYFRAAYEGTGHPDALAAALALLAPLLAEEHDA